ncbi:MAG: hypothetical protein IKJ01_02445 [Lachnospiraceae bacterium]|nr:hypothetical protein [Lachnospiraceae bacterium]
MLLEQKKQEILHSSGKISFNEISPYGADTTQMQQQLSQAIKTTEEITKELKQQESIEDTQVDTNLQQENTEKELESMVASKTEKSVVLLMDFLRIWEENLESFGIEDLWMEKTLQISKKSSSLDKDCQILYANITDENMVYQTEILADSFYGIPVWLKITSVPVSDENMEDAKIFFSTFLNAYSEFTHLEFKEIAEIEENDLKIDKILMEKDKLNNFIAESKTDSSKYNIDNKIIKYIDEFYAISEDGRFQVVFQYFEVLNKKTSKIENQICIRLVE